MTVRKGALMVSIGKSITQERRVSRKGGKERRGAAAKDWKRSKQWELVLLHIRIDLPISAIWCGQGGRVGEEGYRRQQGEAKSLAGNTLVE